MELYVATSGSVEFEKADIVTMGTDFDAIVDECSKRHRRSGHYIFIFDVPEDTEEVRAGLKGEDATSVYWVEQDMWYKNSKPLPTLDEILERSGLSKVDLSRRFGIPTQTVRKWFLSSGAHETTQYVISMMAEILFGEQRYNNK